MSELIELLDLQPHVEGGYYRQLYESSATVETEAGTRQLMNTIHYLLTADSPIGRLHRNRSDITHFLHVGGPVTYLLVSPAGELSEVVMGFDLASGHVLQFTCPGGFWKTSFIGEGVAECLISEAVAPAFHFDDSELATLDVVAAEHPELVERLRPYVPAGS